jgi:peptidoglycan-N-acetylglucosamine deacetylase
MRGTPSPLDNYLSWMSPSSQSPSHAPTPPFLTLSTHRVALLLLLAAATLQAQQFQWPGGVKAAVVLTYDDGIDAHIDRAGPDLQAAGLSGTFYVTGASDSLKQRMPQWRELAQQGHELGNHTVFHPCLKNGPDGAVRDFVKPEYDLDNYSARQYAAEATAMNTTLAAVDGLTERTFAYTCCDTTAGGASVIDAMRPLFPAARGGGERVVVKDLKSVDFHNVPSWMVEDVEAPEMIEFVKEALAANGLAVIMFHGVEGPYLSVSRKAHQELLAWLAAHREEVWTGTFLEVMRHVRTEHKRLGWPQ